MRGKMHRALIRAINTDRLGSVSAAGDLGNRSNGIPRPSASIFFAPRLFPTNKYTYYPISPQLERAVSLTWKLKANRRQFALVQIIQQEEKTFILGTGAEKASSASLFLLICLHSCDLETELRFTCTDLVNYLVAAICLP